MKQVLVDALNAKQIDLQGLHRLVLYGKPYKLWGFIPNGYEPINIFTPKNGNNIFHILAHKGVLPTVLPLFFGNDSAGILEREGVSPSMRDLMINALDSRGFTPAHIAVASNPTALASLEKHGAALTSKSYADVLAQYGDSAIKISPLEYIFTRQELAEKFFAQNIRAGCKYIFELLLTEDKIIGKEFPKYLPYIIEQVKAFDSVNAKNVFDVIFQPYWREILAQDIMEKSEALSSIVSKDEEDKISALKTALEKSIECLKKVTRLINLFQSQDWKMQEEDLCALTHSDKPIETVLKRCASMFLNGTLSGVKLENLLDANAIDPNKFKILKEFVEDNKQPVHNVMAVVEEVLPHPSAAVVDSDKDGADLHKVKSTLSQAVASSILDENIRQLQTSPVQYTENLIKAGILRTKDSSAILSAIDEHENDENQDPNIGIAPVSRVLPKDIEEHKEVHVDIRHALSSSSKHQPIAAKIKPLQIAKKSAEKTADQSVRYVDIGEYAKYVTKFLKQQEECSKYLVGELGIGYSPLHSFILMMAYPDNYFGDTVLKIVANKLKAKLKNPSEFLSEYIETLEIDAFLVINHKLNPYDLACSRDQDDVAKLLLNNWAELYSQNPRSTFESPIKHHANAIIKYLLAEQNIIDIDWNLVLRLGMKYANVESISCYAKSDAVSVENITNRSGKDSVDAKYNILNYALDCLVETSHIERYQEQAKREAALEKIPRLCECIEIIIGTDKAYYGLNNKLILKKTSSLLRELKSTIKALPTDGSMDQIIESMNGVKEGIIARYESFDLSLEAKLAIARLNDDTDRYSEATYVTHLSALSDIGRAGEDDSIILAGAVGNQRGTTMATAGAVNQYDEDA